jgi:acetyltransferase EpsM
VTLSGGVEVGEGAHLGSGAAVIEYKKIGVGTVVGAGSVVISDLPAKSTAYGVPCRVAGEQHG